MFHFFQLVNFGAARYGVAQLNCFISRPNCRCIGSTWGFLVIDTVTPYIDNQPSLVANTPATQMPNEFSGQGLSGIGHP
jgi:hypothetical protein